jgi:uncharacterized iron-regulated membrane protein
MNPDQRRRHADILKLCRKVHRWSGALLFAFFFLTAVTGLLLGWKKHSAGIILPRTHTGVSADPTRWLPLDELTQKAVGFYQEEMGPDVPLDLDRIDVRPDKGIAKFVFITGWWEVQVDCTTGELLHIERRRSDFIENVHDGSIMDYFAGTGGLLKLIYTSVLGGALVVFTVTGFWLWYGPKRFRSLMARSRTDLS